MIISIFRFDEKPDPDFEGVGLQALLIAERVRHGLISPTDTVIELVTATTPIREAARLTDPPQGRRESP